MLILDRLGCYSIYNKDALITYSSEEKYRITSYNVCYTKLLREARQQLKTVAEALLGYGLADDTLYIANSGRYEYKNKGIDVFMDALKDVITSYSIHYTKLYELA